ncbi:RHS repeat domain-containing protein [Kordia sp.]|uniref:RHS repeat domain-containing protein n=1 Tax=Kordia sp. TaxID=1965332 RepID=UPI003B5CE4B0
MNISKYFQILGLLLVSTQLTLAQVPQKTFSEKLDGIKTSSKELTKSASSDNSSVGQSGAMSTSVPLVNVTSRTMSFPIQLNYTAGIKVDQKSGPVGLGWVLPVGSITRDYGAFEPDYSSTEHEGDMNCSVVGGNDGWLNPIGNSINPTTHNQILQYNTLVPSGNRPMPLSDFYHVSVPGFGSNSFWNGGTIGDNHNWKLNEYENWMIDHSVKTFIIDQEYSRINEKDMGAGPTYVGDKTKFNTSVNFAAAIGVLPYVINGKAKFADVASTNQVEYEDFNSFTITDENGTHYVFGRPLRGQKFILQESPYWSTTTGSSAGNSTMGNFWKLDYIAEWLLTEIRSPDYEDLNGNGIADDEDAGDWIRFEYTEKTQYVETVPKNGTSSFHANVPKHREWSSFSQTDQASSLMRERAYLTKIVTPIQEVDFTISKRFDVDHDYLAKPANRVGNEFYYENRHCAAGANGSPSDFDIKYPVETMKYDSIKVYSKFIDKTIYTTENTLTQGIVFKYADKGSPEELAVSDYVIRDNDDTPKTRADGTHIGTPSQTYFDIEEFKQGDKRGKTTLLGIELFGGDMDASQKTQYEFEYAYNPSYSEIHKRNIIKQWTSPSVRQSGVPKADPRIGGNHIYTEQILQPDGISYQNMLHTDLPTYEFLIDIPFTQKHHKIETLAEAIDFAESGALDQGSFTVIEETINPALKPIKDVFGYLYAENCTSCTEAWSLTKITYPTGGQVSFEYESGTFDINDKSNWDFNENEVPLVKEYNALAKKRSYVQDAHNQYAANLGQGIGSNNRQKELTATFELDIPSNFGVRLKKKTISDRVNLDVVFEYDYGTGHYSALPAECIQSIYGTFNQFLILEKLRHRWEIDNYGPASVTGDNYINDFEEKMRYAALSGVALDEYRAVHFYEYVDEKMIDDSFKRSHYGPLNGTTIVEYDDFNLFCVKKPNDGSLDNRYILAKTDLSLQPIQLLKIESFDANGSTPYQEETYTYERTQLESKDFEVDYSQVNNNSNTIELWDNSFEIYLPITPNYNTNTYNVGNIYFWSIGAPNPGDTGFGYITSKYITDGHSLPYQSQSPYKYERWASFKTTLKKRENNYKGLSSITEYDYNSRYQLAQEKASTGYTFDELITEYTYAYETYIAAPQNVFLNKNMLSLPTETTSYLNVVLPSNAVSAKMITYDLNSYAVPRVEASYAYETNLDATFGTFTLTPFDINSSSNPNWRITQNDNIAYNKPGQLISSRANRLYSKTVFGNNINLPKATISSPIEAFDSTYSGFEDFTGRHNIEDWDNDDYQDEKWFTADIETGEEIGFSTLVVQNPCGHPIPSGGLTTAETMSKHHNYVMTDNTLGLTVGDVVEIKLTGGEYAVPSNYSWSIETTVTAILDRTDYIANGVLPNWIDVQLKDYILCFADPLEFPESSYTLNGVFGGVANPTDEGAALTISETIIKKKNPVYNLSKTYARTGKYSYKLPTLKDAGESPTKTAVRPVNLTAPFPGSGMACMDPYVAPSQQNECQWSYEASVWLKYDYDITAIGVGDAILKSGDIDGDNIYQRGTVSENNNQQGVKIICDVYNIDHTVLLERKVFYPESLSKDWKQYTVTMPVLKGGVKWLDVYVQNEREQIGASVTEYKSVFADDIIIYPTGSKYTYKTYDKFGNDTFTTNNNDVFTESVFDEKGRPIVQKNAYGTTISEQTYFEHPNWTNQVNHITERKWVSNGVFNESRNYLDGFGKTKQTMISDLVKDARVVTESNYFNNKGFTTATFKPYTLMGATLEDNYDTDYIFNVQDLYSSSHALTEVVYEAKPEMKVASMSLPRENSETAIIASQQDYVSINPLFAPYGTTPSTQNYPAGSLLIHELTDANGNVTKTYMDNLRRVILEEKTIGENHVQYADGTIGLTTGNTIAQTWFVYDPEGRLIKVVDPTGKENTYEYNSLGVIVKKTIADKGTSELRYDKYGQIRFIRDQKDIDATNSNTFGTDQFAYWKYDAWGRIQETGQKQVATSQPSFTGQLYFDDYTKIEDQNFPEASDPLGQLHQSFEFDGSRDEFNSNTKLCETVYNDHVVNSDFTITAQTIDKKCFAYMADGQLANVTYNYQDLDPHTISYDYNEVRLPIGKRYTHPTESTYNFEWKTNLDNFARPQTNSSIWNGTTTQTGQYYYDVLGNLLVKGMGTTGNATDPHLDYHFYKFDIRDQLTHQTSKYFRFGLKYDPIGNITDQFWSNELFDPTNGANSNINQYHYYYDKMNRLIGADYRLGTQSENPFANVDELFGSIPNDFLCGDNGIAVDEYLNNIVDGLNRQIEDGINVETSKQALNSIRVLRSEYVNADVAYNAMTETQKEGFLANYIGRLDRERIDSKAFEMYRATQERDHRHLDALRDGRMTPAKMKYTQIVLSGMPYNSSVPCDANANATIYGFLPSFPFPTNVTNSTKYDTAYWYTANGNITDLNRNDENGIKAAQNYMYANAQNNLLTEVEWDTNGIFENHSYNYDTNGNIITDSRNDISNISYDDYDELPMSITNSNGTRKYRYDSNGQRIAKEAGVNNKSYYLDGVIINQNNEVVSYQTSEGYVAVSNNAGIVITDYFYNITDWLGTKRAVMDATGAEVNANDHYPFGMRMPARQIVTDAEGNRYQYTGHEYDEDTRYGYHGARYYNRELGRYMNVDPLAEKFHSWSSYNYTMGNPINLIDPTGEGPTDWIKNKDGEYIWDNTVTNPYQVKEGQTYVGPENQDIVKDLFGKEDFKMKTEDTGITGTGSGRGMVVSSYAKVFTVLNVSITANVSYENNDTSTRTFDGIGIETSGMSYTFAPINIFQKFDFTTTSLTVNGDKMNVNKHQNSSIGPQPISYKRKFMKQRHLLMDSEEVYSLKKLSISLSGQSTFGGTPLTHKTVLGSMIPNPTKISLTIPRK